MSLTLTVAGENVSEFGIYSVDISAGRDDIYSQPDGTTLDLEFVNFQAAGEVGDEVVLSDAIGQIFRGWITDVEANLQDDMSWRTRINATGPLALLGQLFAGVPAYPVETDSERIKRIVDETDMSDMLYIDVAVEGFDLAERQEATHPSNAAELARLAADSGLGVFWEQPNSFDKPLRYTPAKYRTWDAYALTWGELPPTTPWTALEGTWGDVDSDVVEVPTIPPVLELDPAVTFANLTFEQTLNDLVRTAKVSYGADDLETAQPEVVSGTKAPAQSFKTILNDVGDATQYALTIIDRHAVPAWRLSSITMDLEKMPVERQEAIRATLQVGTRVIVNMPHGSPVGAVWQGFLEGWELSIIGDLDSRQFIVDMHVSDRFMTEPADRWFDIASLVTWADVDDGIKWEDTTNIPDVMRASR